MKTIHSSGFWFYCLSSKRLKATFDCNIRLKQYVETNYTSALVMAVELFMTFPSRALCCCHLKVESCPTKLIIALVAISIKPPTYGLLSIRVQRRLYAFGLLLLFVSFKNEYLDNHRGKLDNSNKDRADSQNTLK